MHNSKSPSPFLQILHDVAKLNNVTNYDIVFKNNSGGANGYICSITEADIVSQSKSVSLIIKSCGSTDKIHNIAPITSLFKNEAHMYQVVFPAFEEFVGAYKNTPKQFAPIFHNYTHNNEFDALILSNLKIDGFLLQNREEQYDDNYVKLGLDHYAKFHAISLAFKDQKLLQFKAIANEIEDCTLQYLKYGGFIKMFQQHMDKSIEQLQQELNENTKMIYKKFILATEDYIVNALSINDQFSVILHGDCWKNNMMFKYGDSTNPSKPTDMRLIDFQFSRVGSPMLDIANFFYASSSKEVIDNVSIYLDFYYDSLSKHLSDLGSKSENVYPHSIMMNHWKKFAPFGLILRSVALNVLLSSEDDERKGISDTLENNGSVSNLFDYKISDVEKFKDLNKHIIQHFVNNNLL